MKVFFGSLFGRRKSGGESEKRPQRTTGVPEGGERAAALWHNKGTALDPLGRYEEAIACFDTVLEIDPRNADAWINKGNALHVLGRREEAIACYDRALEIDPREADAWYSRALAQEAFGDRAGAIESWRQYLEVARQDPAQRDLIPRVMEHLRKLTEDG